MISLRSVLAIGIATAFAAPVVAADTTKPNVLFIAIDDLRDWVGFLGHKQVKTPNLDKLAARGMTFTRSYCAAPVCNPSRTALLTGLRPGASGVYDNQHDWRDLVPKDTVRLTQHFMSHGYYVAGSGKIWHGNYPPPTSDWHAYKKGKAKGDIDDSEAKKNPKDETAKLWGFGNFRIGPLTVKDTQMPDHGTAEYCLKHLQQKHDKPFFLACGIVKPHLAFAVPQKYFDLYPLDKIELPPVKKDDLDDVPPAGRRMAKQNKDHENITSAGKWKECVQAYLAAISFCDAMVGKVIDGLDKSAYKDNTIIVLWSDHGWHLGEKEHWRKFALWEEATRSPLLWVVPGMTKPNTVCERTVDFMTIYPTLCDLCGLPTPKHVQGESIKRLLADPKASWDNPAITTYRYQNHTVRTEKWRYIRYANGDEELYDHDNDPHEWTNLAKEEKFADVKKDLGKWLPRDNKPDRMKGKE